MMTHEHSPVRLGSNGALADLRRSFRAGFTTQRGRRSRGSGSTAATLSPAAHSVLPSAARTKATGPSRTFGSAHPRVGVTVLGRAHFLHGPTAGNPKVLQRGSSSVCSCQPGTAPSSASTTPPPAHRGYAWAPPTMGPSRSSGRTSRLGAGYARRQPATPYACGPLKLEPSPRGQGSRALQSSDELTVDPRRRTWSRTTAMTADEADMPIDAHRRADYAGELRAPACA